MNISDYPYLKVEIEKSGALHNQDDVVNVVDFINDNQVSDLIVISHGWNNNMDEAQYLYDRLFQSVKSVIDSGFVTLGNRRIGVIGIFWPSKMFTDKDLIPGGGAVSLSGAQSDDDVKDRLDEFASALDDPGSASEIESLRSQISELENSTDARRLFADSVRNLLPRSHTDSDDGSDIFFDTDALDLFDRLQAPFLPHIPGSGGGAAGGVMDGTTINEGGAAGLGDWFQGVKAAARRILNYATYYLMKARAGDVGARGVSEIIAAVKTNAPDVKVHLVGHSFGGRVVTAASKSLGDTNRPHPSTMSLLQAAFSHNGFAQNYHAQKDGYFRSVMQNVVVNGPVLVTHTHNDKANALAYPLASRLAGQDAAAIGDPDDRFGAIGANGAQYTPESNNGTLLAAGENGYMFEPGTLYNLKADRFIANHGDVHGKEVAYAILSAISSS